MKILLKSAVIFTLCCFLEKNNLFAQEQVPQFTAFDIYGIKTDLTEFKGKVIILELCFTKEVESEPERQKLRDYYAQKNSSGLEIISVGIKKGIPFFISKSYVEERAREYCKEHNETWITFIDWEYKLQELFKVDDTPMTLLVDKKGNIRNKLKGDFFITDELIKGN